MIDKTLPQRRRCHGLSVHAAGEGCRYLHMAGRRQFDTSLLCCLTPNHVTNVSLKVFIGEYPTLSLCVQIGLFCRSIAKSARSAIRHLAAFKVRIARAATFQSCDRTHPCQSSAQSIIMRQFSEPKASVGYHRKSLPVIAVQRWPGLQVALVRFQQINTA